MSNRKSTRQSGETRGRKTKEESLKIKEEELNEKELQIRIDKIVMEKGELVKEVKRLKEELSEANEKIKALELGALVFNTDENKIKKVLELRARGDTSTLIQKKMEDVGIRIEIEEIEHICRNKDSLGVEYTLHYNQCIEKFEQELKINPKILKMKALEENAFIRDETMKSIKQCEDPDMKLKLIEKFDKYILSGAKILEGGIVTDKDDMGNSEINIVNNMMEDYEKQKKSNVVKLNLNNIKAI